MSAPLPLGGLFPRTNFYIYQKICHGLQGVQEKTTKILLVIRPIFEIIKDFFLNFSDYLYNKYKNFPTGKVLTDPVKNREEGKEFLEKFVKGIYSKDQKIITVPTDTSSINKVETTAHLISFYYVLTSLIAENQDQTNFFHLASTIDSLGSFFQFFYRKNLDLEFLEKYHLNPSAVSAPFIDILFYRSLSSFSLSYLNLVTGGQYETPLKVASIFINSPIAQKKVLEIPFLAEISLDLKKKADIFREEKIKKPLALSLNEFLNDGSQKLLLLKIEEFLSPQPILPFGMRPNKWMRNSASLANITSNKRLNSFLDNPITKFLGQIVEEKVEEVALETLAPEMNRLRKIAIDKIADTLADLIINRIISIAKFAFYFYFKNKLLMKSLNNHPIIFATSFVIAGGKNQSLTTLSLRVAAATLIFKTKSAKLFYLLNYGPYCIETLMSISDRHKRKIEEIASQNLAPNPVNLEENPVNLENLPFIEELEFSDEQGIISEMQGEQFSDEQVPLIPVEEELQVRNQEEMIQPCIKENIVRLVEDFNSKSITVHSNMEAVYDTIFTANF